MVVADAAAAAAGGPEFEFGSLGVLMVDDGEEVVSRRGRGHSRVVVVVNVRPKLQHLHRHGQQVNGLGAHVVTPLPSAVPFRQQQGVIFFLAIVVAAPGDQTGRRAQFSRAAKARLQGGRLRHVPIVGDLDARHDQKGHDHGQVAVSRRTAAGNLPRAAQELRQKVENDAQECVKDTQRHDAGPDRAVQLRQNRQVIAIVPRQLAQRGR